MSGQRWEIGLLWRDENFILPDSKNMAMMRLQCFERRLDRDAVLRTAYSEKIFDYVETGYFVRLSKDFQHPKQWFLPHFPVVNPNKPNKLRIVFDATAKSHGKSINGFLMTGPDLLKALPGVLFRFRQRRIGFIGDMRELYHRVGIRDDDQWSQLILWRGDDLQRVPDIYKMTAIACSSKAVMQSIPEEKRSPPLKQIAGDQMERTLGIWWDFSNDTFTFRFKNQQRNEKGYDLL